MRIKKEDLSWGYYCVKPLRKRNFLINKLINKGVYKRMTSIYLN
ncbi:Fur-regulated basic protein FbpA [[Brevibacterium] frigoritolerans]|uniref:Fur-regulated basic protein FbpA n=1 Tax=Peribacillus frigoritolerans TaxID=450367 RepID=A0A941FI22_9BACI|nr:Fur-regulated basic protein FbpA [Peribacillus frigoritolerans]